MTLQTTDLSTPMPVMITPQPVITPTYEKQKMSHEMSVTYGICITILVIVIIILIIVICVKVKQGKTATTSYQKGYVEGYRKIGGKRVKGERYNQISSASGIIDYKMLQKDNKIQGQVKYGDTGEYVIHPFMQEYFIHLK